MKIEVEVPDELRVETCKLLEDFAGQMANRLLLGQRQRAAAGVAEWDKGSWETEARIALLRNVGKGDTLDVANISMLMWGCNYRPSLRPALMFFSLDAGLR